MNDDQKKELIGVLRQIDRQLQELWQTADAAFTKWDRGTSDSVTERKRQDAAPK